MDIDLAAGTDPAADIGLAEAGIAPAADIAAAAGTAAFGDTAVGVDIDLAADIVVVADIAAVVAVDTGSDPEQRWELLQKRQPTNLPDKR